MACSFLFHPDEMTMMTKPACVIRLTPQTFGTSLQRQDWAVYERVQQAVSSRVHEFGYAPGGPEFGHSALRHERARDNSVLKTASTPLVYISLMETCLLRLPK